MDAHTRRIGLVLALGGLLVTIDATATIVAIPSMVTDLDSSLATIQWATTGYLLGVVAVIPLAGWAAARLGQRRAYLTALAVFTAASLLAGLAWSAPTLIAFRILQGLGGGLINPVGMAIGLRAVGRDAKGKMMSLLGLAVAVGPVTAPPLAGWLIDTASWRWIFWINLPVGLTAMALSRRLFPPGPGGGGDADPDTAAAARPPVDWIGLAQLSGGSVALVYGCTLVGEQGRLSLATSAMLAAALGLLVAFAAHARRVAAPLVDLRLLRHRALRRGAVVLLLFAGAYFGSSSILPVFVQAVRGDSASQAGSLMLPQAIAVGLTMQVATRLVDRVAPHRIVTAGTTLGFLGLVALCRSTGTDAGYGVIASCTVLLGVGSGATLMPTMTAAVRDIDDDHTPAATTLLSLVGQLAAAIGIALTATGMTLLVDRRLPGIDSGIAGMIDLDATQRASFGSDLAAVLGTAYLIPAGLAAAALVAATRFPSRPKEPTGAPAGLRLPTPTATGPAPGREIPEQSTVRG